MFCKTVRSMGIRDWIILIIASLFIGFCGVYGWSYGTSASGGVPTLAAPVAFASSIACAAVVGALMLLCNAGLTKLAYASLNKDAAHAAEASRTAGASEPSSVMQGKPAWIARVVPRLTAKSVSLFALVLLVFWSPYLVAAFPGTMYNDTAIQMQQVYEGAHPLDIRSGGNEDYGEEAIARGYGSQADDVKRAESFRLTDAWLVDHHPFALTMLYGGVASASDALFGDWIFGFGLLMACQAILLAFELAFCVAYLRKRGAPPSLGFAALAFFCIVPIVPMTAVLVMKDSVFTVLAIPYFLLLAECALSKGAVFERTRMVVLLIVVAVLMCLAKKTGIYVVGATALFGLIAALIRLGRERRWGGVARFPAGRCGILPARSDLRAPHVRARAHGALPALERSSG